MRQFKLTFLSVFLLLSVGLFSQTKSNSLIRKNYHYTFEGELTSEVKTELEKNVSQLKYVTASKIKYKPDSKKGEIILSIEETTKSSEGDNEGFNAVELKKLILSSNLTPLEFNSIEN
jgi:hypothetical protein